MESALRPPNRSPRRVFLGFAFVFLLLYLCVLAVAERIVGRAGTESAFQKLLAAQGQQVDWLVLGASHALPLEFGDIPGRLRQETGQSMLVLAEIGAGPLYNHFVFEQALQDTQVEQLIYVVDSFAFAREDWNEGRLTERSLLRKTPLRASTARILAGLVLRYGGDLRGLIDYLTGFSKLNPVDRFPQEGWQGAAAFDRRFRPSRHAISSRIAYLYPEGAADPEALDRYLGVLDGLFERAAAAGVGVIVMKPPVPEVFADRMPGEDAFDTALRQRLQTHGIEMVDLSDALPDPKFYFDTDHLNRDGVAALYSELLAGILQRSE